MANIKYITVPYGTKVCLSSYSDICYGDYYISSYTDKTGTIYNQNSEYIFTEFADLTANWGKK